MKTNKHHYCTFEQSKKLKALGVSQEANFYYTNSGGHLEPDFNLCKASQDWGFASFSVAELGDMLPKIMDHEDYSYGITLAQSFPDEKEQEVYITFYEGVCSDLDRGDLVYSTEGETEAEARANMLIYLIENEIIQL
jgi:hypothetical protein